MTRARLARELLDADEAGKLLGVSGRYVRFLADKGRLVPIKRTGKAVIFLRSEVAAFVRKPAGRPKSTDAA